MRKSLFGSIAAAVLAWPFAAAGQDYEPPEPPSPDRGQILHTKHLAYLADTAEPLNALAYRARLPQQLLDRREMAATQVKLAGNLADFGLIEAATADYRHYLTINTPDNIRNQAWYDLARAWYAHNDYDRAAAALNNMYGIFPEPLRGRVRPFEARILIGQGRYAEAVELLRDWRREGHDDPFARYNLGVALIRSGEIAEGAGELNAVATMQAASEELQALRDQANLVLAFAYLELGQGATARTLFQRIRLDAASSDKALLGLGWAEIAPDGKPQKRIVLQKIRCIEDPTRLLPDSLPGVLRRPPREACGPPQMFRNVETFRSESGGETPQERYRRALVPWVELIKQDPQISAVQEALVAVPYAYEQLDAQRLAGQYYQRAADVLEDQRRNVVEIIERLQRAAPGQAALPPGVEPDMDWFARRWNLPASARTRFLAEVVNQTDFQQAAQKLQDLLVLQDRLATRAQTVDEFQRLLAGQSSALTRNGVAPPEQLREQQQRLRALEQRMTETRQQLQTTVTDLGRYLRGRALAGARAYQRQLDTYLARARLGQTNLLGAEGAS